MRAIGWFLCETLCLMCARAAATSALLERDTELYLLERVIERAERGHGGVVLVEGQAGVGKTELLRWPGLPGESRPRASCVAAASELDRPFGFGVVRQLLERCVRESPTCSAAARNPRRRCSRPRPARPRRRGWAFRASAWPVLAGRQSRATSSRCCCLPTTFTGPIRRRCAGWCSSRSVSRICRSCSSAATRPAEPGADQALIDVLASIGRVVRPAPLSARRGGGAGSPPLPGAVDEFSAACHAATGGNAFLLGELLAELVDQGVAGTGGEAAQVFEFGSERVGHAVRRRLRLLPDDATAVAAASRSWVRRHRCATSPTLTELDDECGRCRRRGARRGQRA